MKLKWIGIAALLLLAAAPARAAGTDAKATFEQGNQQYEKGEFDGALESYLSLTRLGFGGPALYYDLGNVYYRKGDRGRAVLWYERAARLDPRDSDVQFNLALARSHIKSEGANFLERAATYFSENELAVTASLFSVAFFCLVGWAAIGRLKGEVWPPLLISLSAAGLLISGGWLTAAISIHREPQAVVVSPPGEVRNGPGTEYAVGFTIPEGSRVLILNRRPDWTQIGVPEQGLKGWMPAAEVEPIAVRPTAA